MIEVHRSFRSLTFFRQVSPALLKRYFEDKHQLFKDFSWDERFNPQSLFESYARLDEPIRLKLFEELGRVNDLGLPKAMPYLVKKAQDLNIDYHDKTPYELSFLLFLERPLEFHTAHAFFCLEQVKGYSDYRGKKKGKEPKPFDTVKSTFKETLLQKLKEQERGDLVIECYEETDKKAYVVYYEDFKRRKPSINKGQLEYKYDRPVYEAVIIYYPEEGRLKIKARSGKIRDLCVDTFAKIVLGDGGFFQHPNTKKVYDLSKFRSLPLKYPTKSEHEIEGVREVGIKITMPGTDKTVELHSEDDLPQLIKERNINLNQVEITKIFIKIKFPGSGRRGARTIWLSESNHSNISDTAIDRTIEECLRDWKIANR